jgi:ketosteroid isomerase-like protein
MSEENVEKLEVWLKTWDLDAMVRGEVDFSFVDPDCAYEDEVLPDHVGEVYRGHESLVHAAQVWLEPYETFRIELERILGDGDLIVSIHRFQAKARYSGIEFDVPLAWLFTFQDGIITRWRAYASVDEALEAAGLSE